MATTAAIKPAVLLRTTDRFLSSLASHHKTHQATHKFLESTSFIGSWEVPKNPKVAGAKLAMLRREYAKQVKEKRKEYIREMEAMRIEKQRQDEARKETLRIVNEERKKLKAEAAKVRAHERMIAQQEFREKLSKERAEKLENWRMKEKQREENKKKKIEDLRKESSKWIEEDKLEHRVLHDVVVSVSSIDDYYYHYNSDDDFF